MGECCAGMSKPSSRPARQDWRGRTGARDDAVEEIKIIGLRRTIAERLQDAKRRIPHITYVEEVDVSALEDLREHLNGESGAADRRQADDSALFLIRAIVKAVARYPQCNALFDDAGWHRASASGRPCRRRDADAGGPHGSLFLRHAEALGSLRESAAEVAQPCRRAHGRGRAARDELTGSTITISSLGALGGIVSTPVINSPEVSIIGVNRIVERPVIHRGQIVVRKMMNLSSSFDHRIIDGAGTAASFIQAIKNYLEQPARIFIDDG